MDFKLHFFNEHLKHQREVPLKTRLINHAWLYEPENKLITAGVDGVIVFQFDIKRTQPPSLAVKLDPFGKSLQIKVRQLYKQEDSPMWVQKCRVDPVSNMVFSWTFTVACFHNLSDGKRVRICKDMGCDREKNKITDVALSHKYQYFLVATSQGNLNLWKLSTQGEDTP